MFLHFEVYVPTESSRVTFEVGNLVLIQFYYCSPYNFQHRLMHFCGLWYCLFSLWVNVNV